MIESEIGFRLGVDKGAGQSVQICTKWFPIDNWRHTRRDPAEWPGSGIWTLILPIYNIKRKNMIKKSFTFEFDVSFESMFGVVEAKNSEFNH